MSCPENLSLFPDAFPAVTPSRTRIPAAAPAASPKVKLATLPVKQDRDASVAVAAAATGLTWNNHGGYPVLAAMGIFAEEYRALRPRAPKPHIFVSFYPFTRINNTIRLRDGAVYARLSDALEEAPESVVRAIAHILLAKLYRKPIAPRAAARYRQYALSAAGISQAAQIRRLRGRKNLYGTLGRVYDLKEIFDEMNLRFFGGLMPAPTLTWSGHYARRLLGHYDSAHNAIVISRVFDREQTPRAALEYVMYHEMLHLKHPTRLKGTRRCVHSAAFKRDEELFPNLPEIKRLLKKL